MALNSRVASTIHTGALLHQDGKGDRYHRRRKKVVRVERNRGRETRERGSEKENSRLKLTFKFENFVCSVNLGRQTMVQD